MVLVNCLSAGSIQDAVNAIIFFAVQDIVMSNTKLVCRRILKRVELICCERLHRVNIKKHWHLSF